MKFGAKNHTTYAEDRNGEFFPSHLRHLVIMRL
jgi:hypothetical protein